VGIGECQLDLGHPAIDGGLHSLRHFLGYGQNHITVEGCSCHGFGFLS
jgi:hypothetical protein